jgi:leucyl aminopeptidase
LSVILKSIFLSNYTFDRYKSEKTEKNYTVVVDKKYNELIQTELDLINNICLARDL